MLEQGLVVQSIVLEDHIVVTVAGELNLASAAHLDGPLRELESEHPQPVILVDLSGVEYIDSAGLKVLLDARKRLSLQSRRLHLRLVLGSQPAHVVKTSRLDTIMTLLYE